MSAKPTIVAVNGSPHAGIGNTALMIEMLRPTLAEKGFELEVIHLAGKNIEYCTGCAFCMEKGRCWIDDDHREITAKLLEAGRDHPGLSRLLPPRDGADEDLY